MRRIQCRRRRSQTAAQAGRGQAQAVAHPYPAPQFGPLLEKGASSVRPPPPLRCIPQPSRPSQVVPSHALLSLAPSHDLTASASVEHLPAGDQDPRGHSSVGGSSRFSVIPFTTRPSPEAVSTVCARAEISHWTPAGPLCFPACCCCCSSPALRRSKPPNRRLSALPKHCST